jgi:hypothetical protein
LKKYACAPFLWLLLGFRLIEGLVQAFFPYQSPHLWRQTDTLGVGIRYAQRWLEGVVGWEFWLPAVLNSSSDTGIMPMEFPFYNFLLAAGYLMSWEHGALYASLLTYGWGLLLWGLILWVWRKHHILDVPAWRIWLLLPILGQAGIYWCKLMPDFTAMAFVVIACAFLWDEDRRRPWVAVGFSSLGLLIKPPVCIVFALLLLEKKKSEWVRQVPWILLSIGIAIFYYTRGLAFIRLYTEGQELFATQLRDPWSQWVSLLPAWRGLVSFLFDGVLFPGGLLCLFLLYSQPHPAVSSIKKIGALLLLQTLAILSLDGSHGFVHRYYFIGMSPLLCVGVYLTFFQAHTPWKPTRAQQLFLLLFGGLWVGGQIDRSAMELRPLWSEELALHKRPPFSQCQRLRNRHPEIPWQQGVVFRSDAEIFPLLGVCFGERQGASSGTWGFYWRDTQVPAACREIDGEAAIKLVQCEGGFSF